MPRGPEPADAIEAAEHFAESMIQLWRQAHLEIAPDVSDQQMRTLLALERSDHNLTGLARALGTSPSSATRLRDRLDQRGLIERRASGRLVTIRLSATGEKLLQATREHRRRLLRRTLTDTRADQTTLQDALGQLCALFTVLSGTTADPLPRQAKVRRGTGRPANP
jgi:DNA-binding MarR family transcriptional regulator